MKYSIRKFTINLSKKLVKNTNKKIVNLETKLKHFEKRYENYVGNIDYYVCKQKLDAICEEKAKSIKIRSKCNWYELENSTKFFLSSEKHRAIQSQMLLVIINQDEITDQNEINKQIFYFYQSLFSTKVQNQTDQIEAYLELIPLLKLNNEQTLSCTGIISYSV